MDTEKLKELEATLDALIEEYMAKNAEMQRALDNMDYDIEELANRLKNVRNEG